MQTILFRVAALVALFFGVDSAFAQSWTVNGPTPNDGPGPYLLASSADGTKIVAALAHGPILYTTTNSGETWALRSVSSDNGWLGVASSADGCTLAAVGGSGPVCISTNSGVTWTSNYLADYYQTNWSSVASSADGRTLTVVGGFFLIYTTTNAGATWTSNTTPGGGLVSVTCSSDATKLVAMDQDSYIFASTNAGATWTQPTNLPSPTQANACSVVSSADGCTFVASVYGHGIYKSTDSGATWTMTSAPPINWTAIASSVDGSKLVAATGGYFYYKTGEGPIYTSTNGGTSWVSNNVLNTDWGSVASSADGNMLFASGDAGVYRYQTTSAPQLNITPASGNLLLSWIVPSTNFVVVQNSDLTTANWTLVTNTPVLNLTNLQNEVILSPPVGNAFYRLFDSL
jgi:photosystem II stability/assembly factor-like uncharacterized protein